MANKGGESMTIEDRLENMERELGRVKRRNRWLLGTMLLLVGGLVAAGAFKTTVNSAQAQGAGAVKEVRAKRIVLEDENGQERAILGLIEDNPALKLFDKNGKTRAALSLFEDEPRLALRDENGKERVGLSVDKDGPFLSLSDENGKSRAWLAVTKYGQGLSLYDEKREIRAWLGVIKDGQSLGLKDGPSLGLYDEKGKAGLGVTEDGPGLALVGPDGKVIWSAIK